MRRVKLMSQFAIQEVIRFQQYLEDKATMPRGEFYRKHQEYMGLNDAELAAILKARPKP